MESLFGWTNREINPKNYLFVKFFIQFRFSQKMLIKQINELAMIPRIKKITIFAFCTIGFEPSP
jgi:hypothetical protein